MRHQQAGNVVHTNSLKNRLATVVADKPSRPKPLDAESLKKVVGGGGEGAAPHKGW